MSYYPPVGFYFKVKFEGLDKDLADDVQFQSVSGLSTDIETEEYAEGGENRFKHKLPTRIKFPNLVLKRGLFKDSSIIKWCEDAIENFKFKPLNLIISLYSESQSEGQGSSGSKENKPLVSWKITHAIPVKWSIDELSSMDSKLVMETLELTYNYFKIEVNAN